jgi:two-component system LytT family response regulator
MSLRVLIADDEAIARRRIRRLLQAEPDVTIVAECADGATALGAILETRPDVALLDVQMPELDGFEVVQRLPEGDWPAVIFITAFDRYALRAFDVHALDYLLKPVSADRFRTALGRARDRLRRRSHDAALLALVAELRGRPRYLTRIAVRSRGRVIPLKVSSIDWIQAADNYVTLHAGGHEHLVRETLSALGRQLDPDRFVRIHRSTLVNIDRIAEIAPAGHGDADVRLRDGTALSVSRTWREKLAQAMK